MCDLDPKVKVIGKKAGICDGVPSTAALVLLLELPNFSFRFRLCGGGGGGGGGGGANNGRWWADGGPMLCARWDNL